MAYAAEEVELGGFCYSSMFWGEEEAEAQILSQVSGLGDWVDGR